MTKILYPPFTKEDILNAKISELQLENNKLAGKVRSVEFENGKLKARNTFLENLVEHTRHLWNKGEKFSIKEMLVCLKSGTITSKYQSLND